jgi:hypothetical protein
MPRHNFRSPVARILVALLISAGLVIAQTSAASAAGTTSQTIDYPTLSPSASAPSTIPVLTQASSGLPLEISVNPTPPNACSISGFRVTFSALGTCEVNLDQPGDSTYAAAPRVTVLVTIDQMMTTISGVKYKAMSILDPPFQASLTTSSGVPVEFAVVTVPGVSPRCSVTPSGLITPIAVGDCSLLVRAAAAPGYTASSVAYSVRVSKATQASLSISAPSSVVAGGSGTISVTGGSGTGATTITATGDCTVSGNTVTANSSGSSCTVTATKAGDDQYEAASTSQTVRISAASTGSSGGSGGSSGGGGVAPGPVTSSDNSGDITFVMDKVATQLIKPSLDATDVFNTTGGQLVFTGRSLLSVQQVLLADNLPVKIIQVTDATMTIELPKASLLGWQSLTLVSSVGKKIFTDSVRYLAPVVSKQITKVVTGFKPNQKVLIKAQMAAIQKFVKSVGKYQTVECRGLSSNATMSCKYLKKVYKAGRVKVTKLRIKANSAAAKQVRLVFTR